MLAVVFTLHSVGSGWEGCVGGGCGVGSVSEISVNLLYIVTVNFSFAILVLFIYNTVCMRL